MSAILAFIMTNKWARAAATFVAGALALGIVVASFFVWLHFHDASVAKEARTGYVTQVMLETVQAKLDEQERQRRAAETALGEYQIKAADAAQARNEANAKLEQAIAADTAAGYTWTADDLEWLRNH